MRPVASVKRVSRTALAVVGVTAVTMAGTMFGVPATANADITYAAEGTGTLKDTAGWLDFGKLATGPSVGADKLVKEGDSYTFTDKDGLAAGWSVKVTVSGVKVGEYTYKPGEVTNVVATPLADQAHYATGPVLAALGTLAAPKDNVWAAPFDVAGNRPTAFAEDATFPVAKNTGTTLSVVVESTLNGVPTPIDLFATNAQVAGGTVGLSAESRSAEQVSAGTEKNVSVWTLAENLNAVPAGKDPADAAAKPAPQLINGGTRAFGSAAIDTYDGQFVAKVNAPKTVTVSLKGADGAQAESVGFGLNLAKPAPAAVKKAPTPDEIAAAAAQITQDVQKAADEINRLLDPQAGAAAPAAAANSAVAPGVSNLVAEASVPATEAPSAEPTTEPVTTAEPTPVEETEAARAEVAQADGGPTVAITADSTGQAEITLDGSYPTVSIPVIDSVKAGEPVTVTLDTETFFGAVPSEVGISLRKSGASTNRTSLDVGTGQVRIALSADKKQVTVTFTGEKVFGGSSYARISAKTPDGTVSGNLRFTSESSAPGASTPGGDSTNQATDTGAIIGGVLGTVGALAVVGMIGNQIATGGLGKPKTTPTGRTGANPNGTRSTTTSTASVPSGMFTDKPPVGQTTNSAQGRTTTTAPRTGVTTSTPSRTTTSIPRTTSYTTRTTVPRTTSTTTRTTAGRTTTSRTTTSTSRLPNTGVDATFLWAASLGLLLMLAGASFIATRRYFGGNI